MSSLRQCGDCNAIQAVQRTGYSSMAGPMLGLPVQVVGILTVPPRCAGMGQIAVKSSLLVRATRMVVE